MNFENYRLEKRIFVGFVATIMYFHIINYAYPDDNPYRAIVERNAFTLLDKIPSEVRVTDYVPAPTMKLYLTGIMNYQNITNVYLYSKELPKRFMTLSSRKPTDSGVTLIGVSDGLVEVNNNGVNELLSFSTHKLPNIIGPAPVGNRPTIIKKDDKRKSDKKDYKKSTTQKSANVIRQVPSRRSQVDPRIIEKSLEYLSKMEDGEKREALLERVESLQSGQHQIKSDIDQNERRRQYDEWRKKRERDR